MQTPVTFLVFNRPDLTAQVFARIRAARPPKLLVVCDGPRPNRPDDAIKVAEVRKLIDDGIDWPCEVLRNFAEQNLGCRNRIASGLTWAFEQVEESIILEDDCLPDPSFFTFAEAMLTRYRDDARVMHVAGSNLIHCGQPVSASYSFSRHPWIWGWATWRRAWQHYDLSMQTWDSRLDTLRASYSSGWERQYWLHTLNEARLKPDVINTWDFSWHYTCRSLNGLCIHPTKNLIENLGFGVDATHTQAEMSRLHRRAMPLGELIAPSSEKVSRYQDELISRMYAGEPVDFKSNVKSYLRIWKDSLSRS